MYLCVIPISLDPLFITISCVVCGLFTDKILRPYIYKSKTLVRRKSDTCVTC